MEPGNLPHQESIEAAFRLLRRAEVLRSQLALAAESFSLLVTEDRALGRLLAAWHRRGGVTSSDFVDWLSSGCPGTRTPVRNRGDLRLVVDNLRQ
jgi:hypothetical protein